MSKHTIPSSDEAWDDRTLGADENFIKVAEKEMADAIDEAAGTQLISIRLQKGLIEDFKLIASLNGGIGYQTLMKQILQRFVDSEKKQSWNNYVAKEIRRRKITKHEPKPTQKERSRKAA